MSITKNNLYSLILSAFIMHCLLINNAFAQDNNLYDPLNLYKEPKQKIDTQNTYIPRAIVTSISADNRTNTITIKGMPEINYNVSVSGRTAKIEILNAYLHKSISSKNYNWNAKIKSILPSVYIIDVSDNASNKGVSVNIRFEYPVTVDVTRNGPERLSFQFEKSDKLSAGYDNSMQTSTIKPADIETLGSITDSDSISLKPSGKYLTVGSDAKNLIVSTKQQDSNKQNSIAFSSRSNTSSSKVKSKTTEENFELSEDNEEKIANIPPDLPLPNPPALDERTGNPLPENYNRSKNAFSDQPAELPKLERPETTKNELLKKQDYDDIMRIGISLESENKLDDAIHKYSQAISIDPSRYEAYSAKGDIFLKQDKYELAIENYNSSLNIKDDQVKTIFNLAIAYKKTKQFKEAIANFEKVLEYQPENYETLYNLANLNFLIKDYADAINYYEQCIKLTKKSQNTLELARVYYNLANTYKEMEDYDNAIKEYIESIKLFKEFPDAHYNLAATYLEKGKKDKAVEEFEEFIKYTSSTDEIKRVKLIIEQLQAG